VTRQDEADLDEPGKVAAGTQQGEHLGDARTFQDYYSLSLRERGGARAAPGEHDRWRWSRGRHPHPALSRRERVLEGRLSRRERVLEGRLSRRERVPFAMIGGIIAHSRQAEWTAAMPPERLR
jgi:hypothetical protein